MLKLPKSCTLKDLDEASFSRAWAVMFAGGQTQLRATTFFYPEGSSTSDVRNNIYLDQTVINENSVVAQLCKPHQDSVGLLERNTWLHITGTSMGKAPWGSV